MKRIMAIHKDGITKVNPDVCQHELVVTIKTGQRYTLGWGDVSDNFQSYEQCLDCGKTFGGMEPKRTTEIPY